VSGIATLTHEQAAGLEGFGHKIRVLTIKPDGMAEGDTLDVQRVSINTKPIVRLAGLRKALSAAIDAFQPDFIWCTNYRGFGLPVLLESVRRRIPYGLYLHGTELQTEARNWPRRRLFGKVLHSANCVATNSQNSAGLCQTIYGICPDVITPGVNPPVVDLESAKALRAQWLSGDSCRSESLVLISACRLARGKGLFKTLEALSELPRNIRERITYVIVGSGPEECTLKQRATQLKLVPQVIFTGRVSNDQIATHLAAADIYVQPSQPFGHFIESFGISFLEAQSVGLPCIGTRWGGIPESVREGVTGFLVEPGSTREIKDAILRLAIDEALRSQMGAAGRDWAADNSWGRHIAELNDIICKAAGQYQTDVPCSTNLNLTS